MKIIDIIESVKPVQGFKDDYEEEAYFNLYDQWGKPRGKLLNWLTVASDARSIDNNSGRDYEGSVKQAIAGFSKQDIKQVNKDTPDLQLPDIAARRAQWIQKKKNRKAALATPAPDKKTADTKSKSEPGDVPHHKAVKDIKKKIDDLTAGPRADWKAGSDFADKVLKFK